MSELCIDRMASDLEAFYNSLPEVSSGGIEGLADRQGAQCIDDQSRISKFPNDETIIIAKDWGWKITRKQIAELRPDTAVPTQQFFELKKRLGNAS